MLTVSSTSGRWERLVQQATAFLEADVTTLRLGGRDVTGYRSPDNPALWIRDHADTLRAGVFFRADVWSAVEAFVRTQGRDGRVFDYVATKPTPTLRENWETWVRIPVEADVEYRLVSAAYLAWQATGALPPDLLPALDAALTYTRTDPERWDDAHGLVKRAYTVDTWDFDHSRAHEEGRAPWLNFQLNDDTIWGISHADNSGFVFACERLADLYDASGESARAAFWRTEGQGVRDRANALLWNGRFYRHFHFLVPPPTSIDGLDTDAQLSLSLPAAHPRGLATDEQGRAIVDEYRRRAAEGRSFAPWWGIDPAFPAGFFGEDAIVPGAYCNGGIMPLVGGDLARTAFATGREAFGVETLTTYADLVAQSGETYLWYFPDGTASSVDTSTSPEATPTDGWGTSAMLLGVVEGLAGVKDLDAGFRRVRLSPRWVATGEDDADVRVSYAASGAAFGYAYRRDRAAKTIALEIDGDAEVALSVLLPEDATTAQIRCDGRDVETAVRREDASPYAEAAVTARGRTTVEVTYG